MSDHGSSTDTTASSELKAGHAPAIKVGGMRVGASRPRQTSQGDDKERNNSDRESHEDGPGDSGNVDSNDRQISHENQRYADNDQGSSAVSNRVAGQMVSGTFVPIQKAFPTEAVKHIHEKPGTHAKHESHAYTKHEEQRFLNQPRK